MASVLLVEDDMAIAEPLARALVREGHDVEHHGDGVGAAAAGMHGTHDLVILDLGLPDIDGVEVCRRIRGARPEVPIMMLTARGDEIDAIVGLDAGADDYQSKPFRLAELMARVRALTRRAPAARPAGGVRVDEAGRRAWAGERELALAPREFDLLALLCREAGRVVRRERIMHEVWDANWSGSTKTLDVHVSALRRKLGDDPAEPRLITTVRGVGLRFEAE
ncbi:MAG TPA: response regulator transcription factor [Miltoncostaea sp.]|nr:response regulator transcription factor [Miltoncostaea sp.]